MTQQQWQSAFGGPGASFDARVEQTLKRLEEENKMKQYSVRAALIALALILAMTGVVYAVSTHWMIGDYVGGRGAGNLPQDFDSGYEESFSLELGGVRFRIRDAYVNGNTLMAVTEVSRADGKPAIFMGPGTNEEDPIDDFDQILSWELRDGRSAAALVDEAPDGESRSRRTRLLLSPPAESTDELIAMAQECVTSIRRNGYKKKMKEIEAQMANSSGEEQMRLLAEYQALTETLQKM